MANTTNYNWETPDDTDLVKDGAAAIRTLGNSIDTTTKALNPETTLGDIAYRSATSNTNTRLPIGSNGQILGVSAGVPAWINNDQGDITEVQAGVGISIASGTGPIPVITNSSTDLITTAGDILYGTAADTVARLGIGTAGQVLKVNSGATAPEWGSASATSGPAFRAFRNTSTQSVTGGAWTKVQLNGETFDTDSCFDSTTNYRFTPNVAGYYSLTGSILGETQSATTQYTQSAIYKNGAEAALGIRNMAFNDDAYSVVHDLIYLNGTTDYVELYGFITAGTVNENFANGTTKTFFTGVWIRS
jgi:hypothetical protein